MKMIMRYQVSFDCDIFDKEKDYIDLGGYSFVVDDKDVPFDFEAYGYDIDVADGRVSLEYESGRGFAFNEYDVNSCFDEEYEKLSLTRDDITAEFLASTTKISEFYIAVYCNDELYELDSKNFKIDYIEFIDYDTDKTFKVDNDVLQNINI